MKFATVGTVLNTLIAIVTASQEGMIEAAVESTDPVPVSVLQEPGEDTGETFKNLFRLKGAGGNKPGGGGGGKGLLRGFLPALPGIGGLGFVGGGTKDGNNGGGKGFLRGLSAHGQTDSENNKEPENGGVTGTGGGCDGKGAHMGWQSGKGSGGGGKLKLPFGRGGGLGKLNIFGKLGQDLPCAAGIGTLPLLDKIPGIPKLRFPSFVPSGVNTCDATCGGKDSNNCTYNWRQSLTGFPFLLFRCECKNTCPPKKILFGGYLNIGCENVSNQQSRCKCPSGQHTFKCTINVLPVFQRKNAYYCACCTNDSNNEGEGGYDLGGGGNSVSGGYAISGAGDSGGDKEVPHGQPLGSEHYYSHL